MENIMNYLNLVITLAVVLGGAVAFRYGLNRTANEVQERVIHALQSEIDALKDRIVVLERDNQRLTHILAIIRSALKQRGLSVTIEGDLVSIQDSSSIQVSRIQNVSASANQTQSQEL